MEIITRQDFEGSPRKVTRRRISKACLSCRAKKIKCDQQKPQCTSCRQKRIGECIYEDSPFQTLSGHDELSYLRAENERLKAALKVQSVAPAAAVKVRQPTGTVAGAGTATSATSAAAAAADYELDAEFLGFLFRKKNRTISYGATSYRAIMERHRDYYLEHLSNHRKNLDTTRKQIDTLKNTYLSLISIPDGPSNPEALLQHLRGYLPDRDTIAVILLEYVNGVWHQLFPVLDRDELMADFERIFARGDGAAGSFTLKIEHKISDYARIALVLVVMKTVLIAQHRGAAAADASVFTDANDLLVVYANRLLECAKSTTRTSFPTLQTVFMMRLVKRLDPLDGDGGDLSNGTILFSLVVEMAITLGLHRDIGRLYRDEGPARTAMAKNLWRCILLFDALNSFDIGVPLHVSDAICDVSHVDDGSLLYRTTLCLRSVLAKVNGPKLMFSELQDAISTVRDFYTTNFDPIYGNLRKLSLISSPDAALLMHVCLTIQVLAVLSGLSYLGVIGSRTAADRTRYRLDTVRYGMLCGFVVPDTLSVVQRFNHSSMASYSKNQYTCVFSSLLRQPFTRTLVQCLLFLVEADNETRDLAFRAAPLAVLDKIRRSRTTPLVIDLDAWQHLDERTDTVVELLSYDVMSQFWILTTGFRIIFQSMALEFKPQDIQPLDDRSLFHKYAWMLSINGLFNTATPFAANLEKHRCNFKVDYSVLPSMPPYDSRVPPSLVELLEKKVHWDYSQNASNLDWGYSPEDDLSKIFFTDEAFAEPPF